MKFFVTEQGRRGLKNDGEVPYVVLHRDSWDDYGYQTTFSAQLRLAEGTVELGSLKILHAEQKSGRTPMPTDSFETLGKEYCSLGADLSYYEELFKRGPRIYRAYLRALSDVAYDDRILARFEDLEGYKVSLLRFSGAERTISDAHKLFKGGKRSKLMRKPRSGFWMRFKTQVAEESNPFLIEFDFRRKGRLPSRMNVVIGYNGSGKTRLLSNLAVTASGYGYARKEDMLSNAAGKFIGTPPPFNTVVVVSYSAFDTFVIPGRNESEKVRLEREGAVFGYSYCGLRERASDDEDDEYRLRTPKEVEDEFISAVVRVREAERIDALVAVIRPLLKDASFQRIGLTQLYTNKSNNEIRQLFRGLSSGHKIVLKIIVDLAAQMDDSQPTLVLIDEPETHLHPPLLAALLKSIRACLDHFDGYAVVATHSPVVLQETPSRYVHVLKRNGLDSAVVCPSIETFGENIGLITQEVFNLDDGSTDWHDSLKRLAQKHNLKDIEKLFDHELGFAARSYVISLRNED